MKKGVDSRRIQERDHPLFFACVGVWKFATAGDLSSNLILGFDDDLVTSLEELGGQQLAKSGLSDSGDATKNNLQKHHEKIFVSINDVI